MESVRRCGRSADALKERAMGQTERGRWHGKVVFYPGHILVGPGRFHEGPDFIQIEEGGRYRWEYVELAEAASGAGRWSLVGPLKDTKGSVSDTRASRCLVAAAPVAA
jgi:hypothetical protein